MMDEPKYLTKIGDIYFFADDILGLSLTDFNTAQMVRRHVVGLREFASDKGLWKTDNEKKILESVDNLESKVFQITSGKISNYQKFILNYSLVMLCSVFDKFEEDLLNLTIDQNPLLCSWTRKNEITGSFRHGNVSDRFKVFTYRLGLKESELFDFSRFTKEVQEKFSSFGLKSFVSIYKKRDKAAHEDYPVVSSIEELRYIKDLFEKLIFIWSILFRSRWHIKSKIFDFWGKS